MDKYLCYHRFIKEEGLVESGWQKKHFAGSDPWIMKHDSFVAEDGSIFVNATLRVSDLIIDGTRRWNIDKLENFSVRDVGAILFIPLILFNVHDLLMWHYEKSGNYSVKSGYHLNWQIGHSNATVVNRELWKHIWNLKIPPKICDFM